MYFAVDIGGTHIRVVAFDSLSSTVIVKKEAFLNQNNPNADIATIMQLIHKLSQYKKIQGIGISIAGQLNSTEDVVLFAPNFSSWNNLPVKSIFREFGKCPIILQNDAVAGAYGETVFGKKQGQDCIYLIWGTGIGGAQVTYSLGKPFATQLHWSSHFPDWEADCGGKRIQEIFGKSAENLTNKEWLVIEKKFAVHLEKFLQKTKASLIIVGGGIGINQPNHVLQASHIISPSVEIAISTLGEKANILGSFYLLQKIMHT